ncbi:MAG: diacylglycerol kinase family protein [Patescibacteria group bacterium]
MDELIKRHHISFKNAFSGLIWALTTQPNFRVHAILATIAILTSWYVGLTQIEWVLIILTIIWGMSAELINTALEAMTDLITSEWRHEAKIAKDVAAGMMLTVAGGSVIIAFLLLVPKLIMKLM